MKKQIFLGAVLAAVLAGSCLTSVATAAAGKRTSRAGSGDCQQEGEGSRGDGFLKKMAKELKLTAAQQEKVAAVIAADREKSAPLREKLDAARKQLHEVATAEPFDEAAVRSLAVKKAEMEVDMTVSRAKTRNSINALLTPEQRAKAEKMRPQGKPGRGMMPPPPDGMPPRDF